MERLSLEFHVGAAAAGDLDLDLEGGGDRAEEQWIAQLVAQGKFGAGRGRAFVVGQGWSKSSAVIVSMPTANTTLSMGRRAVSR